MKTTSDTHASSPPDAHTASPGDSGTDAFGAVRTWVFDLDNTLYPPEMRLFDQIEVRMNAWIMRTVGVDAAGAAYLRRHYWQTYGTTLAGLMHEHEVDPEEFLVNVHDISFGGLRPDPLLRAAIRALPGRAIIYTNGTAPYAENVLAARGLSGIFDAIYGVEHAQYRPKPLREAFTAGFARDGLDPARAAMFEDDIRNLVVPHEMGMRTVHVAPGPHVAPHISHHTSDLTAFVSALARRHGEGC